MQNLTRINTRNNGYYLVKAPDGYPGKKYSGIYTYEHRAVWWMEKGYLPPDGYHIHHINGDIEDNRIENLESISAKDHVSERHHGGKEVAERVQLSCQECLVDFEQLKRTVSYRLSQGQSKFYCSKRCQVIFCNKNRKGIKLKYPKNRKSRSKACKK